MSGTSRASVAALLALTFASGAARSSSPAIDPPHESRSTRFVRTPLATGCLLGGIAPKGRGRAGGTLSIAHGERLAAMADSDNDRVAIVDLSRGHVVLDHTIAVGRAPAQVAMGSDGRVFVTERQSNTVSVYEASSGRLLCRARTPADPVGIALSPDEKTVLVTSGIAHALSAFDTETFAPRWSIDVPREPRGVAMTRDGHTAYVAHLAGAPLSRIDVNDDTPRLHPMPPVPIASERHIFAIVRPHWRERWFEEDLFKPEGDRPDDTGLIAHSLGPIGTHVATSIPASTPPHIARSFGPIAATPPPRPPPALAHVAPIVERSSEPSDDLIHPVASQAWTVAMSDDDEPYVAFMVNRTGREVPVAQRRDAYGAGSASPEADGEKLSFALGRYDATSNRWAVTLPERLRSRAHAGHIRIPSALAIDPRTRQLVVAAMGTQRVARISREGRLVEDPADTIRAPCGVAVLHDGREVVFSQLAHAVEIRDGNEHTEVPIGVDEMDAQVAHGRTLFYSADDSRLSSGGLSCGGCHPEGRDDGLVWFLAHGPRQTPTLAGRLEHPFNWNGTANDLSSNIVQTIRRLGGTGVKTSEIEALSAFLTRGLRAPNVEAPVLTAEQTRGREVFDNEAACSACHESGRNYTDGLTHALGGLRRDETRRQFDTPSLRFLDSTAPYFHDGRFATVHEMLLDGHHHMGRADRLAPNDLAALESYLHTL